MSKYLYQLCEADVFTVGFYDPQGKWVAESDHATAHAAADRAAFLNGAQGDIWALIRPGTKYQDQCNGEPFRVQLQLNGDGFIWRGGIGGQYRHSDLILMTKDGDQFRRHPLFHNEEDTQVIDLLLTSYQSMAERGDLYPEWVERWATKTIRQIKEIQIQAEANYKECE